MSQKQLIQRLKQQPRHSAIWSSAQYLTDLGLAAAKATNNLDSLTKTAAGPVLTGLEKVAASNQVLVQVFTDLNKYALKFIDYNKELNKSFSINTTQAAKLSQELHKVAAELEISGVNIMKYAGNIKRIVPTLNQVNVQNKTYYKGLIAVQRVLTTNLGLSEQQAEEYTYFAAQQGKNAALTLKATEAVASALDPEGDMGYFKIITEGVAKAGASAQLSFGKMPGNLEVAVLKANRLGLEIADLKSMSDSLLNIESSIGQELEYQLLSGHRLVGNEKSRADFQGKSLTNLYRSATLQRDASKQASILNTILEQEGETLENNVIARQQMSQLLGIDEEKLSRALQKKKLLEASGAEILMELEGSELEAAARGMMDTGQLTEEAFQDLMKLSDNRTTEDIMKEQLQAQQDLALNSYLTNDQLRLIAELNGATQKDAQKYNEKLLQYSEEREKELGKVLIAYRKPLEATVINTARDSEYGVPKDVIEEQDALIMNDGFIRFNPLDKFMQVADGAMIAGTNVDGNKKFANALNGAGAKMTDNQVSQLIQAFAAVGSLIENAINSQTTALKRDGLFAPGINGSTY